MIITCPKCEARMTLSRHLTYPMGPAKLIYACTANPNHVRVFEEATVRELVSFHEQAERS